MDKIVCYCCTRNKYEELRVAIKSLQVNNPDVYVIVFAEDDDIGASAEVINLHGRCEYTEGVNSDKKWTYMTNVRLAFTKYLKYDKVLYLDIDTIVNDDISELWDLDLTDYYVAGCKEPFKSEEHLYINAGVTMLNLAKLRDGTDDVLLETIRTQDRNFPDQDVLNEVLRGHILQIPGEYNYCPWVEQTNNRPKIIHYAAKDDWSNERLYLKYKEL